MPWISDRLRQPDGCPWDREQTHESLRNHLLEEAYEVYDALEAGATPELAEELGDLLLQVVLHAQLAAEEGVFDLTDVQAALATKIVRRHPHVFGEAEARDRVGRQPPVGADQGRGTARTPAATTAAKGALDGISASLPALAASQEMQERAANLGYDWPSLEGVLDKVIEETRGAARGEPPTATTGHGPRSSATCCSCSSTSPASRTWTPRRRCAPRTPSSGAGSAASSGRRPARGVALRDLDFAALDALWDAAKAEEKATT